MVLMSTGVNNEHVAEPMHEYGEIHTPQCRKRKHEDEKEQRTRLETRCIQPCLPTRVPVIRWASTNPTGPDPSLALFRKSSPCPAKKYTRPPTKRVFESLKITPEEWVRLEGEAKAYMLNAKYPERQACVGNRSSGPANNTKINLFKTVQSFLQNDIGERFFGEALDAPEPGSRWVYPKDETPLILHLTPLMRRMVTNERQRQYARRTRAAMQRSQSPLPDPQPQNGSRNHHFLPLVTKSPSAEQPQHINSLMPSRESVMNCFFLFKENLLFRRTVANISITFAELQSQLQDVLSCWKRQQTRTQTPIPSYSSPAKPQSPTLPATELQIPTTLPESGATIPNAGNNDMEQIAFELPESVDSGDMPNANDLPRFTINVLGPYGLTPVGDEENWDATKTMMQNIVWMVGDWRAVIDMV